MQRPTRLRILRDSAFFASAITAGLAAILETATNDEFPALRSAIGNALSEFFPFWLALFALIIIVVAAVSLASHYNFSASEGRIFSRDGVLLFDREQHIAISVPTMKAILLALAKEAPKGRANELLYLAGQLAGKRFGSAFKGIYTEQIEPQPGNKPWIQLSDNDKLDAWERYDSTVGWGQLNAHKFENSSIIDVVFRHPTLYQGPGGELFAWLLAGYSQEVAAALLERDVRFDPRGGFVHDDGILRLHYTY